MTRQPDVVTFLPLQGAVVRFEWNSAKAAANLRKHRIDFDLALTAFGDPYAIFEQDRVVDGEMRWQLTGMARGEVLLLVAHVPLDTGDIETIRIISARRTDRQERRRYEQDR